jgi:hypothetical protein
MTAGEPGEGLPMPSALPGARITQAYENPGTAQYDPADYQLQYVNNFLMTRTPTNLQERPRPSTTTTSATRSPRPDRIRRPTPMTQHPTPPRPPRAGPPSRSPMTAWVGWPPAPRNCRPRCSSTTAAPTRSRLRRTLPWHRGGEGRPPGARCLTSWRSLPPAARTA